MGDNQSKEQNNATSNCQFLQNFEQNYLLTNINCKIGTVYQHQLNKDLILERKFIIKDPDQENQWFQCKKMLHDIQIPNVIMFHAFDHFSSNTFCNSNQIVICYFEFVESNLQMEIDRRKLKNEQFLDKEIWHFLWIVVKTLTEIKNKGHNHKDIRPSQVFIKDDGSIKIQPLGSFPDDQNAIQKYLMGENTYLPIDLRNLLNNNNLPNQINWNQIDSYALGQTILDLLIGQSSIRSSLVQIIDELCFAQQNHDMRLIRICELLLWGHGHLRQIQIEELYKILLPQKGNLEEMLQIHISHEQFLEISVPCNPVAYKIQQKHIDFILQNDEQISIQGEILNMQQQQSQLETYDQGQIKPISPEQTKYSEQILLQTRNLEEENMKYQKQLEYLEYQKYEEQQQLKLKIQQQQQLLQESQFQKQQLQQQLQQQQQYQQQQLLEQYKSQQQSQIQHQEPIAYSEVLKRQEVQLPMVLNSVQIPLQVYPKQQTTFQQQPQITTIIPQFPINNQVIPTNSIRNSSLLSKSPQQVSGRELTIPFNYISKSPASRETIIINDSKQQNQFDFVMDKYKPQSSQFISPKKQVVQNLQTLLKPIQINKNRESIYNYNGTPNNQRIQAVKQQNSPILVNYYSPNPIRQTNVLQSSPTESMLQQRQNEVQKNDVLRNSNQILQKQKIPQNNINNLVDQSNPRNQRMRSLIEKTNIIIDQFRQ